MKDYNNNQKQKAVGMELVLNEDGTVNSICTGVMQLDSNLYQRFMFVEEKEQSELLKELADAKEMLGNNYAYKRIINNERLWPALIPTIDKIAKRAQQQMAECLGVEKHVISPIVYWDPENKKDIFSWHIDDVSHDASAARFIMTFGGDAPTKFAKPPYRGDIYESPEHVKEMIKDNYEVAPPGGAVVFHNSSTIHAIPVHEDELRLIMLMQVNGGKYP
ncbi:MAG: hypothetical protein AABY27_05180, partial [Pseudomonadota bacterium]